MLIPIRCYTCNLIVAGKWERYVEKVKEHGGDSKELEYLTTTTVKTAAGKALDEVGLKRPCCRALFLGHVELLRKA
jgi:DNA-directed RNA polymerase subunit N (RpoN/RPB10)